MKGTARCLRTREFQKEKHEDIFEKKASATRIFPINLRKFFPPDDDYATCMARLLILREDLLMEVNGILAGPIERLDGNGIHWRHSYFFRNFSKTMQEISGALQQVQGIPEFQRAFTKGFTPPQQRAFKDFCKQVQGARGLIKKSEIVLEGT